MGELLTLEEVGRKLKIKAETVRRFWIRAGKLPAVKVGHQWRVDADDLEKVLEQQAREQSAQKLPDPFSDLNLMIAKAGQCTRASEKDQHQRDTGGREWTPPDIPE